VGLIPESPSIRNSRSFDFYRKHKATFRINSSSSWWQLAAVWAAVFAIAGPEKIDPMEVDCEIVKVTTVEKGVERALAFADIVLVGGMSCRIEFTFPSLARRRTCCRKISDLEFLVSGFRGRRNFDHKSHSIRTGYYRRPRSQPTCPFWYIETASFNFSEHLHLSVYSLLNGPHSSLGLLIRTRQHLIN